jgi:hypothetical protein
MRLITGKTASGNPASRTRAAIDLVLQLGAFGVGAVGTRAARGGSARPAASIEILEEAGDGAIHFLARSGDEVLEVVSDIARAGDTVVLSQLHVYKASGVIEGAANTVGPRRLIEMVREFGRLKGAKTVRIEGGVRATGRTAGRKPRPITIRVE